MLLAQPWTTLPGPDSLWHVMCSPRKQQPFSFLLVKSVVFGTEVLSYQGDCIYIYQLGASCVLLYLGFALYNYPDARCHHINVSGVALRDSNIHRLSDTWENGSSSYNCQTVHHSPWAQRATEVSSGSRNKPTLLGGTDGCMMGLRERPPKIAALVHSSTRIVTTEEQQ